MIIDAYCTLSRLALPVGPMVLKRRLAKGKEDAGRLTERQGFASLPRPDGPLLWMHGASVGESQSALAIIHRLLERDPALNVLLTTGTVTSANLLATRLPERAIHQFVPLDIPQYAERFIRHWRPDAAIWIESEIWPNLIRSTAKAGTPMALLNARMSARSFKRWNMVHGNARRLLSHFQLILAQSDAFAERFTELTGRNVSSPGNLKHCADPLPADETALAELRAAIGDRPCFLAASLHVGEDAPVLNAHGQAKDKLPRLLTILAPRHPERGDAITDAARNAGLVVRRRSLGELPAPDTDIFLADTLGEMGLWFRLAPVSLIGGSLLPDIGGHNMLEPARLNSAVLTGPYIDNFRDVLSLLESIGGVRTVSGADDIASNIVELLENPDVTHKMAQAAFAETARQDGLLDQLIDQLQVILPKSS